VSDRSKRTWWLDTTTLHISFERKGRRVAGIPRVAAEILKAARRDPPEGARLALVRYDDSLPGFREVGWDSLEALLARAEVPPPPVPSLRELANRLSGPLQDTLKRLRRHSLAAAMGSGRLARRAVFRRHPLGTAGSSQTGAYWHPFAAGDSCWWHGNLPDAIAAIRAGGTDVASYVLIHDCMPLIFPEFFPPDMVRDWRESRTAIGAGTKVFLAYSENTRRDMAEVLLNGAQGTTPTGRIRLGETALAVNRSEQESAAVRARLGLDEPYVLIVGTMEVRKNHALALRAWRTLLRRKANALPKLVFVGKWGWKTRDLREQIRDSDGLSGRVLVLESLSDAELDAVYRGALFTLCPSLYEGWGLPLRESHAYGKVCVAARNSALTEAGGDLAIYFTNDCQEALVAAVEPLLADPDLRRAREAKILSDFAPVSWDDTWRDLAAEISQREGGG
jgi:glycosyltransferase involved in cell wall biosynthesis